MGNSRILSVMLAVLLLVSVAEKAATAARIHVLIVADSKQYGSNYYGDAAVKDMQTLKWLFESNVPSTQLRLKTLTNNAVTKRNILRHLQSIDAGRRDGLVFLWIGHGAYDERGHYFHMPNNDRLYRSEVVNEARKCGAGSDIILSASCNVYVPLPHVFVEEPAEGIKPPVRMPAIFRSLFLEAGGLVDINACSRDEVCVGVFNGSRSEPVGTTFFVPFEKLVITHLNDEMTWSMFAEELSGKVKSYRRREVPSSPGPQTVKRWHLPNDSLGGWPPRGNSRYRPLGNWHPDIGDIIVSVNGQKVSSKKECIIAVNNSPAIMEFEARGKNTGNIFKYRTRLLTGDKGHRFGVDLVTDGGGARITHKAMGMPIMHCQLMRNGRWQ